MEGRRASSFYSQLNIFIFLILEVCARGCHMRDAQRSTWTWGLRRNMFSLCVDVTWNQRSHRIRNVTELMYGGEASLEITSVHTDAIISPIVGGVPAYVYR